MDNQQKNLYIREISITDPGPNSRPLAPILYALQLRRGLGKLPEKYVLSEKQCCQISFTQVSRSFTKSI